MKAGALNRYGWILLLCLTGLTQAATLNITAEYNPANYLEEGAKFINTTPCTQSLVNWCSGTATVDKPQAIYVSTYTQRAVKDTEDKRFGIHYLSFPPAREVILTSTTGGGAFPFKFILTDIGSQIIMDNQNKLQEQGDCINDKYSWNNVATFQFSKIKESMQSSGGVCYSNQNNLSKTVKIASLYLGYKLKTPNPLTMPNGTYVGRTTFTVGAYKDFDLGGGTYSDNSITIIFTVKVMHQIKVEFTTSESEVELKPPYGWTEWMQTGRVPVYLTGELPYKLWATSTYAAFLKCDNADGLSCQLKNTQTGHKVRLTVYNMSTLGEQTMLSLAGITKFPVNIDGAGVIGREQKVIFKIEKSELGKILKYPGGTYKGTVTIVFDALL
ncbi:hypothetical protein [Aeromonas sp. S41-2]|uniref:hypothetical protein n=1 Tax=Aeromonas sp. S41-2 TaxID=2990502 RepID=UPI0022E2F0D0|nr:hypothetical protein [Aeromonas sp. S41-2]